MPGQRRGQHDLWEQLRRRYAQHLCRLEQTWFHATDGEHGVDQDRIERAQRHQEKCRASTQTEHDHRQRQPCGDRDRTQQLQRWLKQSAHDGQPADQHAQRQRNDCGEQEGAIYAADRCDQVGQQHAAERIIVDAAERKIP